MIAHVHCSLSLMASHGLQQKQTILTEESLEDVKSLHHKKADGCDHRELNEHRTATLPCNLTEIRVSTKISVTEVH